MDSRWLFKLVVNDLGEAVSWMNGVEPREDAVADSLANVRAGDGSPTGLQAYSIVSEGRQ